MNYTGYENTDYAVINHSTNDLVLEAPIGTIRNPTIGGVGTTFDDTTFIGAYQKAIEHIQTIKPEIRIVLVTPLHRNSGSFNSFNKDELSLNVSLMDYRQAVLQLGLYYSLEVIDLTDISGINMNNLDTYSMDGLHLHDVGYRYSALPFINKFVGLKPLRIV